MPKLNPSTYFLTRVKTTDPLIHIPFSSHVYSKLAKKDFLLANDSIAYINIVNGNTDNIQQIKTLNKLSGSSNKHDGMHN